MDLQVSVIIPTFNRLPYLKDALDSALKQSRPPEEIIVVDDGSTDGTEEMMKAYPKPVRYIRKENAGPAAARNLGMREARSTWIAFLDSDDIWLPDKMRMQADFLERHPKTEFLFGTQVNIVNGVMDNVPEILDREVYRRLQTEKDWVKSFFDLLLRINPVSTSVVLFQKSCLDRVGFFEERLWRCEDYELWFRFAKYCRVGFLDEKLAAKRSHGDNLINDYMKLWAAHLEVLQMVSRRYPDIGAESQREWKRGVARTLYRLGSYELSFGRTEEAARWFEEMRCLDLPPFSKICLYGFIKKILTRSGLGSLAQTQQVIGSATK